MKDGVRIINVARGLLLVEDALRAALDSGKVAGAALDVFREEPVTEHPLFGYPNVVVTPHLGASTAEATDRAGYQAAEQVVAALTGGVVTSAVNVPAIAAEDLEALGPFLPLARDLGRIAVALAEGTLGRRARDRVPRPHRRARHPPAHRPGAQGRAGGPHRGGRERRERARARRGARHRTSPQTSTAHARDFTDLVRVTVVSGGARSRVVGTTLGRAPPPAPARGVGLALQRPARAPPGDLPLRGPAGHARPRGHRARRGAASTSSRPRSAAGPSDHGGGGAMMLVTADSPVPQEVVDRIVASDGFDAGRTDQPPGAHAPGPR